MAKLIQKDQSQFSELLYNSLIMNKDKNPVTEKVLNHILEIICLLTGEDCIIVKKRSERVAQDVSAGVSEEFHRTQNHCIEPSPNPLTHSENNDQALHPPTVEVPVRCEDIAVYLSQEESEELDEHKKHEYMIKEEHQLYSSEDESVNRNTPERCCIPTYSQGYPGEDNQITQDYQIEPGAGILPLQCKEEAIPTEISTGEFTNRNSPEEYSIPLYSPACTDEDNWIAQDYQVEPGVRIVPQQCKEEAVPTVISKPPDCDLDIIHVTQIDGANLAHDSSSINALRNFDTSVNTEVISQEELHLTGRENLLAVINRHKKRKTKVQRIEENLSEVKNKFTKCEKNVTNKLHCISLQGTYSDVMYDDFEGQAHFENNSEHSTHTIHRGKKMNKRIHIGEKTFQCSECGKSFTRPSGLVSHQIIHTGEKPFQCSECGKCFSSRNGFNKHQSTHTGEKKFKCSECEKSFTHTSYLLAHQKIHKSEKSFVCSECGKSYWTRSNLLVHQIIHTQKPFSCSDCGKCFADQPALVRHHRTHSAVTPLQCSECGKYFKFKSVLIEHQRTHTGDKPHVCSECGKSFIKVSGLVVHQRIHTGEKPFVCSECGKSFTQRSILLTHQAVHIKE